MKKKFISDTVCADNTSERQRKLTRVTTLALCSH